MNTEIVTSIIAIAGSLIVCVINNIVTVSKTRQELQNTQNQKFEELKSQVSDIKASNQQTMAVMQLSLDNLTKQVEKHNSVIERTYHLEERMSVVEEKQKVANHRIEDMEKAKSE